MQILIRFKRMRLAEQLQKRCDALVTVSEEERESNGQ